MARQTFRLDRRGASAVLRSQTPPAINDLAEQIGAAVRADVEQVDPDIDVVVESYTTDRGAAAVTIADVRGRELQATRGSLTKAAASLGLDVKQ